MRMESPMRRWPFAIVALLLSVLAGCHRPLNSGDPDTDRINAQSLAEGRAMIGKEYIIVAPLLVCPEQDAVNNRAHEPQCRFRSAGRFRVEDAALNNRDNTILRIGGADVSGFILYRAYLPRGYQDVQDYFGTRKRE
jgi:hypothetical protein